MKYAPLHVHSHYSLLDSIIKTEALATRCKELEMPACAQTDHGSLAGSIDFYNVCKKNDVKPLLGCEIYVTEDVDNKEEKNRDNFHLVLIAVNATGWSNLIWLQNNAVLNNFYYKPRIYRPLLESRSEGLIATSACLASYFSRLLLWDTEQKTLDFDNEKQYLSLLRWFTNVFPSRFYLEVQPHTFWEQRVYNDFLITLARKESVPLVITTDAHFLKREDFDTHELMMAMQLKKTLEEYRAASEMRYDRTAYVQIPEEIEKFAIEHSIVDAMENTLAIADQCNLEIEFGKNKLPEFDITKEKDYAEFLIWQQGKQHT